VIENARHTAGVALDGIQTGPWERFPESNLVETPPLPNDDPAAQSARERYRAGDYEGVLGSPDAVRSEAGLSLRKLAALQLLRKETDPTRLGELVAVLANPLDFTSPVFLEEAENRFSTLKLMQQPILYSWRVQWEAAKIEVDLAQSIRQSGDDSSARWINLNGKSYFVELSRNSREWRVSGEAEVMGAASVARFSGTSDLAQNGLSLRLSLAGKILAGSGDNFPVLVTTVRDPWRAEVVLANQAVFLRGDARTRNLMAGVMAVAGLAVLFGLVQAGRAYSRAVELARRQSEFMAAVSHEMRTPLAAMRLLAENLESGVADRAGQREQHTKLIREECSRLGELVDNVLAFTRGGKSEPFEAFDVAAMVADVASLVEPMAARKNIRFECAVTGFPEPPSGDVAALRRALLNLLDNALKHTPDGGKVSCHAFPADGETWKLEISDTGPGIPIAERDLIFDAFYRIGDELRRTTPGTGLGLALVKRTAEAHGGTITVGDAPDGGSVFTLSLPIKP
jgi:signal transduction histidine kinase